MHIMDGMQPSGVFIANIIIYFNNSPWPCYIYRKGSLVKGGRMGRSDKVSLWCVSLLINTRFRFFILE